MSDATAQFAAGVIEGFYGQPWSQAERFELFDWMTQGRLNTYLYAPKDDLKHRALWREPYGEPEQDALRAIVAECKRRDIRFIYGISPGLDIRYDDAADLDALRKRLAQMQTLGCHDFALLFDDIPTTPAGSVASAQARVANALLRDVHSLLFCPTVYCSRMLGKEYLVTLGRDLAPDIQVFWTGPEIISREITVEHARELQQILRRKPVIWDNLFANDYDGRRFYCGPYAGRPADLRKEVAGLLVNPNNEFPLNFVPLRAFAQYVHNDGPWDARKAYLTAMREWLPRFATISEAPAFEDIILFGDCYYLPHEEGPEAEALLASLSDRGSVTRGNFLDRAKRLRDFCARLAELRDRALFYALFRRAWELREELDLLIGFHEHKDLRAPFRSNAHLPGTYRGGMVARLQRLLTQNQDGAFTP